MVTLNSLKDSHLPLSAGIKLLFNAGIAAFIFPVHSLFERRLKGRLFNQ